MSFSERVCNLYSLRMSAMGVDTEDGFDHKVRRNSGLFHALGHVLDAARSGDLSQKVLHIGDAAELAFDLLVVLGDLLQIVVELFKEGRPLLVLDALKVGFLEFFLGIAQDAGEPLVLLPDGEVFQLDLIVFFA